MTHARAAYHRPRRRSGSTSSSASSDTASTSSSGGEKQQRTRQLRHSHHDFGRTASSGSASLSSASDEESTSDTTADENPSLAPLPPSVETATVTSTANDDRAASSPAKPAPTSGDHNTGPYKLVRTYQGEKFFDGWNFWDKPDPTHGQVAYLDQEAAKAAGLISASSKSAVMRIDNSSKLAPGQNRKSVRIHSREPVKLGSIVIADILRMPFGCATWPAYWTNGPNWPDGGEIDIVEGVHNDKVNQLTLHTKDSGCKLPSNPDITGKAVPANVDCNAHNNGNTGCSWAESAEASYGQAFNAAGALISSGVRIIILLTRSAVLSGGGVLALLFSKDAISIWFWSHGSKDLPENIAQGSPDMATWGKPSATWPKSSCDIAKYFADQELIFNISLCGDWAGSAGVWALACKDKAATCSEFIADPANFDEAVWEITSVKVYSVL
ncbi:hypothetical protein JCM3774_001312 [Rhodotorula dairenensis]